MRRTPAALALAAIAAALFGEPQALVRSVSGRVEVLEPGGTAASGLFLRVGRVHAEVKTTEGLRQDFRVRSPVSTAA